MDVMTNASPTISRQLSHVEVVHAPGDRELVFIFFGLLGIEIDLVRDGRVMVGRIDRASHIETTNANYMPACQVEEQQWALDQAIAEALRGPLADLFEDFKDFVRRRPERASHICINFTTTEAWEAVVDRMANVDTLAPELAGRVKLFRVSRPGDAGAISDELHHAFIWTDVVSSGSLAFGQRFELAHKNNAA